MATKKKSGNNRQGVLTAICKAGTLAHNRAFTASEMRQYAGPAAANAIRVLKKKGFLKTVEGKKLYPTERGWNAIELCVLGKK